ncbi:MAG: hypothetical protein V2A79_12355 [Planctomycetota bacterium]
MGSESLTLALQALLRSAGCAVPYRTLNAALGLSFMTAVRHPERCLATWLSEGRDAFLVPIAARFGVRLRELHPPEAAIGVEQAPEFAQHFQASYRPLIARAIEHDQPVLACRGWPGEAATLWGVITGLDNGGLGLRGTTMISDGEPVALERPPVQVYVVEEIRPRVPSEDELLSRAVRNFRTVLHNRTDRRFGITTGPEAYQAWLERLRQQDVCAVCREQSGNCHRQMARLVTCARESAADFLAHYRGRVPDAVQHGLDAVGSACDEVRSALTAACDQGSVDVLIQSETGRSRLAAGVQAARDGDRAAAESVDRLCEKLGI